MADRYARTTNRTRACSPPRTTTRSTTGTPPDASSSQACRARTTSPTSTAAAATPHRTRSGRIRAIADRNSRRHPDHHGSTPVHQRSSRLQRHGSKLEYLFDRRQWLRALSRRRAMVLRHSSEQYRRFACCAESISAPQVGHRRTRGGSTPPAARIVHIHEHRLAVGGRPGGMRSPQYAHRCGCCECVALVRAIVLAIHGRNGLNPPTGWQSRGLRTRQATRPCVHRDTGRPDTA